MTLKKLTIYTRLDPPGLRAHDCDLGCSVSSLSHPHLVPSKGKKEDAVLSVSAQEME